MKLILKFILFIELLKRINFFSIEEYLNNSYNYRNELCSYNGISLFNHTTNEVTCICHSKYTDEPDEKKRKYINGHFIKCSYKRKSRFMVLFFALCIPLGIDYLYLERYLLFIMIFILTIILFTLNIIIFYLNYQINMKSKETIIQNKINKLTKKEINPIINKDNKLIKRLNVIAKIIAFCNFLYILLDILGHATGFIRDNHNIKTENDFGYMFSFLKDYS